MGVVLIIVNVVLVLLCAAMIVLVLMQKEKSGSLSPAIAGGNEDNFYKRNKNASKDEKLAKYTKIVAIVGAVLCVASVIIERFV